MKNLIIASILLFSGILTAQTNFGCMSHHFYEEQIKNDPVFKSNQEQLENYTRSFIQNYSHNKSATATYVIPIVFHIIHTGGAGNISDAQVLNQISILNTEFNRQQADTVLTPAAFKPFAAGISVEFRLATIDPNGNCTNGIERIYSTMATCSHNWDEAKNISYWPSNKYLNIWIVESMHYPGNYVCNGGGYSAFPGGPANKDGIVMRGDLIGSIGTAPGSSWGNFKGRYLIHELGHWFNLRHIWGDANCGNDFVSDTPPAITSNGGCPSFPRNPNNSCGSNSNGEMFTNYMDYTNGPCLNMFTIGQVARMTAAITSSVSLRNNLWSAANLNATGTNDPYIYPAACAAVPQILPYGSIIACVGDSVKFTDYSYGGTSTSRLWNFSGQAASSFTDSIVKVKYPFPGTYDVALTKNLGGSSNTQTFTAKVTVMPSVVSNTQFPFSESFEVPANFSSDWTVVNRDAWFHSRTWETFTTTSYSGSSCVGISNYGNIAPATDDLISPTYSLMAAGSLSLSFRLHFTARLSTDLDKMIVYMSQNCGQTWQVIYSKNNAALKTVSTLFTSNHIPPAGSSEWRNEIIDLSPYLPINEAKFRFAFTSGGGNNIFIDDINLIGFMVGQRSHPENYSDVKVFPNPSSAQLTLQYNTFEKESTIEVSDVLGKKVYSQEMLNNAGENKISINTNGFANGVYLIKIKQDNKTVYNTKFIQQSPE